MAERLKDLYMTPKSISAFTNLFVRFYPGFDQERFLELVLDDEWESRELKQRMRHSTLSLHEVLPSDYERALEILYRVAPHVRGFEAMVPPDYVEVYGMEDWDRSLPALGYFTRFSSSEFAVRPFLKQDPGKVMAWMLEWAEDPDDKVRRFASEGCRPRLPWAMALPAFKRDPRPILPVLEKLKDDESETVRRSVANNLNDISKDNPELMLEVGERWYGKSERTDWIVKHACRSLLKAGNRRALRLFGHGDPADVRIENFRLGRDAVTIGDTLPFSFTMTVGGNRPIRVRIEYRMDFARPGGKSARKIFKLTEKEFTPGEFALARKYAFVDMSTRKHYPGTHRLSLLVNGEEKASVSFELV